MGRTETLAAPLVGPLRRLGSVGTLIGAAIGIVVAVSLYVDEALFISTASGYIPLTGPILVTPDWASWFDAFVLYPILLILVLLLAVGQRTVTQLILGGIAGLVPAFHVMESYAIFYNAQSYTITQQTELIVCWMVILTLLIVVARSPLLADLARFADLSWSKRIVVPAAAISLCLGLVEMALRLYQGVPSSVNWISDIGIAVDAGARDLLHGVSPYSQGLPPWGGRAGIPYGPVTFLAMVPFTLLSPGWSAYACSLAFALATAAGIWSFVRIYSREWAIVASMMYLAMPPTAWAIEAGGTIHFVAASLIVWSLYLIRTGRISSGGIGLALGALTNVVPAILVLPILLRLKRRTLRIRFLLAFLLPIGVLALAALKFVPHDLLAQDLSQFLTAPATFGLYKNYLGRTGASLLGWEVLVGALGLVLFNASIRDRALRHGWNALLVDCTTLLLIIPFVIGFFAAYFFVWMSAVLLLAMFAHAPSEVGRPRPSAELEGQIAASAGIDDPLDQPAVGTEHGLRAEAHQCQSPTVLLPLEVRDSISTPFRKAP